ncbi:MAG: 50S ribosomal protein L21 [Buchnera aphidicola (Chaetogeoica yunlongensis)]
MYAIFCSGGKQHAAKEGKIIRLEKINQDVGTKINFKQVLMYCNGTDVIIGKPNISNNFITANIIKHGRHKKINIIKFNRRKHYKKKQGHRQYFTDVLIIKINNTQGTKNGT